MLGSAKWSYSPHKAAECIPIGFLPSTGHPVHLFIQQIFSELLPCARHYSRHWGNRCEPHRQNFMLSLGLPPSKTFNSIKKKKHLPLVINNGLENQIQLLTYPSAIVEVSILFFLDYLCVI